MKTIHKLLMLFSILIIAGETAQALMPPTTEQVEIKALQNSITIRPIKLNQSLSGVWTTTVPSMHRRGKYAQYYTFTLSSRKTVVIDLKSSRDAYMFLLSGKGTNGTKLAHNDDYHGRNSHIEKTLQAGSYTIEATTYRAKQTGSFTVSLKEAQAKPKAPSKLRAINITSNRATLTWRDNANNEKGFKIYRGSSYVGKVNANIKRYTATRLKANTSYTYRVKAYNDAGESTATSVSFKTKGNTCISLQALKAKIAKNEDVTKVNTGCITDMSRLFYGNKKFNQDISNWDVSNVTNMSRMFQGAEKFNQPIGKWNVSKVTNMKRMFSAAHAFVATSFNQPIGNWNVSSVTNMENMFTGAEKFNQAIGNWNVSKVTTMSHMFSGSPWHPNHFNQAIGNWNVSHVTNMSGMFRRNVSFNQAIGSWDVSHVTTMFYMFTGASKFNQPIGNWNVSSVRTMKFMFYETPFNQPIGNWNVSHVIDMQAMFVGARKFNQPIRKWDVSSVTNMAAMFADAISFNQPIENWNVSSVTTMAQMFSGASAFNKSINSWNVSSVKTMKKMFQAINAYGHKVHYHFNQDISQWNVSSVKDMSGMFKNTFLSTENYDKLLQRWSQKSLQNNVHFDAGKSHYSPRAKVARDRLTQHFKWVITDYGTSTSSKPKAYDGTKNVIENSKQNSMTLKATDVNHDPLSYHIKSQPHHGSVSISGNKAFYTPTKDYKGTDSFTFVANDGKEDSNIATIHINIAAHTPNKDSDGDHIPDQIEMLLGMDKNNRDENHNGIADGLETTGVHGDTLFNKQWHIRATGSLYSEYMHQTFNNVTNDLDLISIYSKYMGYNHGKPIIVQVVDTGIDSKHEDLVANMDLSRSLNAGTPGDPIPLRSNAHGTMCAGIIGARAFNGKGVRGVAPFVKIAGSNWLHAGQGKANLEKAWLTGPGANEIAISSNSWGYNKVVAERSDTYEKIMAKGTQTLRNAKGRLYLKAAGNNRYRRGSANIVYTSNSRYVFSVAALRHTNTYASYSSPGGNILISGYSGNFYNDSLTITTTSISGKGGATTWNADTKKNYTYAMNGTSAATPSVAGVLALVLEACPTLTWREAKYLVAKHGKKVDVHHPSWVKNAANLWHSSDYGYGLINGKSMIEDCSNNDVSLGIEKTTQASGTVNTSINDGQFKIIGGLHISQNMIIEWIELTVDSDHPNAGDYRIELISPSGTVSNIVNPTATRGQWMQNGFRFGVAGFMGEQSQGEWKVKISDLTSNGKTGKIHSLKIKIYGH